jgi:excisionase family DNA binding protein
MSKYKSPLLTRAEAAQYLHVSPSSLDRLADREAFPKIKLGTIVRFLRADLDAYIDRCYRNGFKKFPFA